MNHFEIMKIAADGFLVLSLLYLSVRFMRSQGSAVNVREIRDLEIVLRTLMKDADTASRTLNDSLARRQQSLERLLGELDNTERRINNVVATVEEQRIGMPRASMRSRMEESASSEMRAASMSAPAPVWAEPASFTEVHEPRGRLASREALRQEMAEQASAEQSQPAVRRTGAQAYAAAQASSRSSSKKAQPQRFNIFGEPIGGETTGSVQPGRMKAQEAGERPISNPLPPQPLARSIEVERDGSETPARGEAIESNTAELERVYESAERLIREGNELSSVAQETQLPMDEVRALSKMLVREETRRGSGSASSMTGEIAENEPPAASETAGAAISADPRLGVLGAMKRQVQVL